MYTKTQNEFNYEPVRFQKPSLKKTAKTKITKEEAKKILKKNIEKRVKEYESNYFNSPALLEKRIEKVIANIERIDKKLQYLNLEANFENDIFISSVASTRRRILDAELFRLTNRLEFLNKNPDVLALLQDKEYLEKYYA
jgi:hypothetical protein